MSNQADFFPKACQDPKQNLVSSVDSVFSDYYESRFRLLPNEICNALLENWTDITRPLVCPKGNWPPSGTCQTGLQPLHLDIKFKANQEQIFQSW